MNKYLLFCALLLLSSCVNITTTKCNELQGEFIGGNVYVYEGVCLIEEEPMYYKHTMRCGELISTARIEYYAPYHEVNHTWFNEWCVITSQENS